MAAARDVLTKEVLVNFLLHGLPDSEHVHINAISAAIAPDAMAVASTEIFRNLTTYDRYFARGERFQNLAVYFITRIVDVDPTRRLEAEFQQYIYRFVMGSTPDISWEIIMRILSLVRALVRRAYESRNSDRIFDLLQWTGNLFLSHNVEEWINVNGGWEAVPDWNAQPIGEASRPPAREYEAADTPPDQIASRFYESGRQIDRRAAASPIPRRQPRTASPGSPNFPTSPIGSPTSPFQGPTDRAQSPTTPLEQRRELHSPGTSGGARSSAFGRPIPDAPERPRPGKPWIPGPPKSPSPRFHEDFPTPPRRVPAMGSWNEDEVLPPEPTRITPERNQPRTGPLPPQMTAYPSGAVRKLDFTIPPLDFHGRAETPPLDTPPDAVAFRDEQPFVREEQREYEPFGGGIRQRGSPPARAEAGGRSPRAIGQVQDLSTSDERSNELQFAIDDLRMHGSPPPVASSPRRDFPAPEEFGRSPPRNFSPLRNPGSPRTPSPPRGASPMQQGGSPPRDPQYPQYPASRSPQRSPRNQ